MKDAIVGLIKGFFEVLDAIVDVLENTTVNTISALSPWIAPLIPASLVYFRAKEKLQFESWQAFFAAMVIEFIGLSSVSTLLKFWHHNKKYSYVNRRTGEERVSKSKKAPVLVPLFTALFYLITVLSVTIILELDVDTSLRLISIFLLSSLSVPAFLIVASRSLYTEILKEMEKSSESYGKKVENKQETFQNFPTDWRNFTDKQKDWIRKTSTEEILKKVDVTDRTVRNWKEYMNRNGH